MRCQSSIATVIGTLCCCLLLVLLSGSSDVTAHKSVRHHKPKTEEARWAQHRINLAKPPEHHFQTDAHFLANQVDDYSPLRDQGHKSYHKRWGPQHPDWTKHHNYHYRMPMLYQGHPISDEIAPEDYHLFGLRYREHMTN